MGVSGMAWYGTLCLLLVIKAIALGPPWGPDCSSLLKFDDQVYFIREERLPIYGVPTDFNVDWKTNDLFFTLVTNKAEMRLLILLNNIDKTSPKETRFHLIPTPGVGQTSAIDNKNNIIYIGTDSGVFTYDYNDQITHHSAHGEDVMYMTVSNDDSSELYIATYPYNRVQKIVNQRRIVRLPMIRNGHGIKTNREYIYYYATSTKTPYFLKKNTKYPRKISNVRDRSNLFFYVAKTGQTQIMDIKSNLYYVNPGNETARFMGTFNIDGVSGFGMDSQNNIFIGTDQAIIKFAAYKFNPCRGYARIPLRMEHLSREYL